LLNFLLRTVIHEKFINALITFRVIGKDRVTLKLVSDVSRHGPGERGNVVEVGAGQGMEGDVVDDAEPRVRAGVGAEVDGLERGRDHAERRAMQRRRGRVAAAAREWGSERVADPVVGVVGERVDEHGRRAEPRRGALDGAQRRRVAGLGDVELAARQRGPQHRGALPPMVLRRDDGTISFGEFETTATLLLGMHLVPE